VDQLIQIAGAVMILLAFAALQLGRTTAASKPYLVLNLIGSAVLAALAVHEEQLGFLLLEGVWAIVSAWSLWRVIRGLPVAGAH
jgi:predicted solute-binding protein